MSSKVAISADDIRTAFTASKPTRSGTQTPDFKLKRFDDASNAFGNVSLCQGDIWNVVGEKS